MSSSNMVLCECVTLALFSFLTFSCLQFHTRLYWLYRALWMLTFLFSLIKGGRNRYRSFETIGNSEIYWVCLESKEFAIRHTRWWVESRTVFQANLSLASPRLFFVFLIFYLLHHVAVRIKENNACESSFLNYKGLYKRKKIKKHRKLFISNSDTVVYLFVISFMLRMFSHKWGCGKTFDHA